MFVSTLANMKDVLMFVALLSQLSCRLWFSK